MQCYIDAKAMQSIGYFALLVILLLPIKVSSRITIQNIEFAFNQFSFCKFDILFLGNFDFNPVEFPTKITGTGSVNNGKTNKVQQIKWGFFCQVYLIFTSDSRINMEHIIYSTHSLVTGKKLQLQAEDNSYQGNYQGVYFVLVGSDSPKVFSQLMTQLMRDEFPNHWFYFRMESGSDKVVLKTLSYLCLRCISPTLADSNFEFSLWNWEEITEISIKELSDLSQFIRNQENKIGMLYWWDYYHLPIWKKHAEEMLSFGPRNVLKELELSGSESYQLVSSDILFQMALGRNKSLEYSKFHNFYRQTQGHKLQNLQIAGAPYLTQDEDGHPTGFQGTWLRNFHIFILNGNEFKFMTCSPVSESHVNFQFYFQPFGMSVWILILFLLIVQPTLIIFGEPSSCKYLEFVVFFFSTSLIEVPSSIPKQLRRLNVFALLFLFWSLISLILSNGYKGVLTNYMITPLKDNTPKTWAQLLSLNHFKLWTAEGSIPQSAEEPCDYGIKNTPDSRLAKTAFIKMREEAERIRVEKNISKKDAMDEVFRSTTEGKLYPRIRVKKGFDYKSVEKVISNCENSVIVETPKIFENYIKKVFPKRSSKANKFYTMSEDSFKGSGSWIAGSKFGNPQIIKRIAWIIQSGLFDLWKDIFQFGNIFKNMKFKFANQFEPLKLFSNIANVFILYGMLIILCAIIFVVELCANLKIKILKFRNLFEMLLEFLRVWKDLLAEILVYV